MLGNSTALNAAVYLLLKSEMGQKEKDIDSSSSSNSSILAHPVMTQLQKCNTSKEKFKEEVTSRIGDIDEQVKYLVKAAALITKSDHNVTSDEERTIDAKIPHSDEVEDKSSVFLASEVPSEDDVENESNDSPEVDNMKARKAKEAAVLNEARFGLRPSEVVPKSVRSLRRKAESDTYFGDLNQNDASSKTKFLASAINSIEQRSVSKKKRKNDDLVEQIDEIEVDSDLAQGLKMMEEELRKLENADGEGGDITNDGNGESTVMHESGEGGMDFYSLVANRMKEKKMIKKKRYEVAPKYPGTETEITGERAISRAIMKNRGLVAHKAKINRNPRVKKREQYRKALIRRKGAVREVRTDEGHKYSGEGTGIKSGISRSRKL
jgi:U3 small nucleolar RNA-associated protein 3